MKRLLFALLLVAIPAQAQQPNPFAGLPDWFQVCAPDLSDFAAHMQCVSDQMPPNTLCQHCNDPVQNPSFSADCLYKCVGELHPNPELMYQIYLRDLNRLRAEGYITCLERARNRRKCKR